MAAVWFAVGVLMVLVVAVAMGCENYNAESTVSHIKRHCLEGDFHPRGDGKPEVHFNRRPEDVIILITINRQFFEVERAKRGMAGAADIVEYGDARGGMPIVCYGFLPG